MALLLGGIAVAVGLMIFLTAQHQIRKFYDSQLVVGANVLRALMADELAERHESQGRTLEIDDSPLLSAEDRAAFNDYADWRMFRMWHRGKLELASDTGPPPRLEHVREGFHTFSTNGETWRIYTLPLPADHIVVQVGEDVRIRHALLGRVAIELALPLALLVAVGGGLIWLSLGNGLVVIKALMTEVSGRSAHDLSEVRPQDWPIDLEPLIVSINTLFRRLDQAFTQERRFTDQAAHQLRTPLATLKLQTQMLAREEDAGERRALIDKLGESVERATDLVQCLLTLARLEAANGAPSSGDLHEQAVAAIEDLAPAATARGVQLAFEADAVPPVCGDSTLLRLIVANLLENAVRHAPAGSEVGLRIARLDGAAALIVDDHGPGIDPIDRRYVFERFYRGRNETHGGAGLGLAIVAEAVRVLGGRIALEDRADGAPGLVAHVTMPTVRQMP
jgi:signal transduction histidine kinase